MIHEISGLERLTNLETLDLSNNQLYDLGGLDCLPGLKTLNLSGNKLKSRADIEHLKGASREPLGWCTAVECRSFLPLFLPRHRLHRPAVPRPEWQQAGGRGRAGGAA